MGVVIPNLLTEDRVSSSQIIDGGLRFGGDTPQHYLTRTTSTPTNAKIFTFSCWFKRSLLDSGVRQFISNSNGANDRGTYIGIESDAFIAGVDDDSTGTSFRRTSSGLIRDSSSWYHLVWVYDTTQSTTDAAIKIYLNGVRFDTTSAGTYSQNYESRLSQSGKTIYIGSGNRASSSYTGRHWNGFMSQVYFIDGQALDPSYFGFTDPLTNTWRPKKLSSSVAFGTNGFYLPFDGNSPIGQDQSGRGNNWTPVNFGGSNTLEKATGALPILNTDGGGKVARVGVRTDSSVGVGATCVLALPLVGIKSDFSNQVDSRSSNNAVSVNNGGPVASTEQSNFYGGSFKFDGTDDYLTVGSAADWKFLNDGTPWTIEFWYYVPTGNYGYLDRGLIFANTAGTIGSGENGIAFYYISSALRCGFVGGPNSNASYTSYTFPKNKWVHVAGVFDGSKVKLYVDGVEVASTSNLTGFNTGNPTATLNIGRTTDSYYYNTGYVQDYRIYKGAKYTQNFIPASTDPDILPDTPSGVSYSSNVKKITDGAVAFDGSGDYLSVGNSADFQFGTGDFTVECFAYFNDAASGQSTIVGMWGLGTSQASWLLYRASGNLLWYTSTDGSSQTASINAAHNMASKSWNHIAYVRNSGTTTIYVNGKSIGSTSSSINLYAASCSLVAGYNPIGGTPDYMDGFISNLHLVKGTALYTSNFTPPTAPITSVANTKLLCCKSNSSATTFDVSPGTITANGNAAASNFNPFNTDINTQRGQESGYCTLNPLDVYGSATFSNGNLTVYPAAGGTNAVFGSLPVTSGKWYWEITVDSDTSTGSMIGITDYQYPVSRRSWYSTSGAQGWLYYADGSKYTPGNPYSNSAYGSSYSTGSVIGVALDMNAGTCVMYKNGISQGTLTSTGLLGNLIGPALGQGASTSGQPVYSANFGQKPFKFPPPDGFQPLALANTPRPTIVRPDQYVGIVTYSGNDTGQSLNVGFKPDLVWIKERNGTSWHRIIDAVRGTGKEIFTNATNAEASYSQGLNLFTSNGFTLGTGSDSNVNTSGYTYVAWAWKAGGNSNTYNINDIGYSSASAAGLTAGTITPTGASVNTKSGFSIITYAGGQGSTFTLSHGLNAQPAFVITKARNATNNWGVYYTNNGVNTNWILLNSTAAQGTNNGPLTGGAYMIVSSTTLQIASSAYANDGSSMIAYCWAEIPGFSKFGIYTGNGSSDGPMVVTGFRPRYILVKNSSIVDNWEIYDTARSVYNPTDHALRPDTSGAEYSHVSNNRSFDINSNGFKVRGSNAGINGSGNTIIYAAFAESPSFNLYGGQSNAR